MLIAFKGLNNQGKEVHVSIDLPPDVKKYEDPDQNLNLTLKRIVCEILSTNTSKTPTNVHVSLKEINKGSGKLIYVIKDEPNSPLHMLALQFNTHAAFSQILQLHVEEVDQTIIKQNFETILERFSETDEKPARTIFEKILKVFRNFFQKIKSLFKDLSLLFRGINPEGQRLKWNLTVLSEVCGSPHVDKLTMYQSLKYISKMLKREKSGVANEALNKRIHFATKVAKKVKDLRHSFSKGDCKNLNKLIKKTITALEPDEKTLIPVGYFENHNLVEMLLEISKDGQGTYNVVLISASNEARSLFDKEVGLDTSSQSIRREITKVNEEELLASMSTLIELQAIPECQKTADSSQWRNTFLQTLRYDNSTVAVGEATDDYYGEAASGHLRETISYAKAEQRTPEDSKRFELGVRLRFFLDICKNNKNGLKDQKFWTLVRTTALQLGKLIEEDKQLLGSQSVQGLELSKVYVELKELLDGLEKTLPTLTDLRTKPVGLFSGPVEVSSEPAAPFLVPLTKEPTIYPNISPALELLDKANPTQSIVNWGQRCRELITLGEKDLAGKEAMLMARVLPVPEDAFWNALTPEGAQIVLTAIGDIGEAIFRKSQIDSKPTLQEAASLAALNCYAYTLTKKIAPNHEEMTFLVSIANTAINDLKNSRLSHYDKEWLSSVSQHHVPHATLTTTIPFSTIEFPQALLNLSQFTAFAVGAYRGLGRIPFTPLEFEMQNRNIRLKGSSWGTRISFGYETPLSLQAPEYAKDVSHEITNRYLTEFCCLGCIRDNCPNYNAVDKKQHRFHPLYMLHNFVDTFCEQLITRGLLHRDEASDLMYTQQTNQNANHIWTGKHNSQHGFDIAQGFDENDYRIQLMNTFSLFLDRPHFFKVPDLRWQFETKIFTNQTLTYLFNNNVNESLPFILSMISKLKKEVTIAHAGGDVDLAAYFVNVLDEIKSTVQSPSVTLDPSVRDSVLEAINIDADNLIFKWSQELVSKSEESAREKQKTVLSILLSRYYKKFCENSNDPCFSNPKHIEMIFAAIGRIENSDKGKEKIDPELKDQYNSLIAWMLPKAKECISKEKFLGDFTNKILFYLHPGMSAMRLAWEANDFPTMLALDESGEFYQFDLLTGELTFGKVVTEEIPENIKRNANLQRVFGEALQENWKKYGTPKNSEAVNVTAYTHPKFPGHRILLKKADAKAKRGLVEGKSRIVIEKTFDLPKSVQHPLGKQETLTFVRFDEQDVFLSGKEASSASDIPPEVAMTIGNRSCWVNKNKSCLYVFEEDNKTLYAVIQLNQKKPFLKPFETSMKDVYFTQDDLYLLAPNERELEAFSSIEDHGFIQVTGKAHKAEKVAYVRYELATGTSLVYDLDKNGITTKAFPGYFLEPFGKRPGNRDTALGVVPLPETFDGFHLLKKDGAEKVLIPLRKYEQELSFEGEALPKTKPVATESYGKSALFEYDLDRETNRLVAKSGDAYAYLAYISLAHWDYTSASYYLNKAYSSAGYDKNYETIFKWIDSVRDETPNSIAMNLRFELFHEKMLDDKRIQKIKDGKLAAVGNIDITRMARLKNIADLYDKYSLSISSRSIGQQGSDPSLDLSPGEEEHVAFLIKELLAAHGDQPVETNEPTPIRAEAIALQVYPNAEVADDLGISKAAKAIWVYKGNDKHSSSLTIQDPEWIVEHFQDLFNQLLTLEPDSLQFKQLEHKIRMLAERDYHPETAIDQAQVYLLKLISAKKLDPKFAASFKQSVGLDGKLPRLQGPLLKRSRLYRDERMSAALMKFDKFALRVPARALSVAQGLLLINSKIDDYDLVSLGKKTTKFIKKWQATGGTNFHEELKKFLMGEIYGESATKSIMTLNDIFSTLDGIPLSQPIQRLMKLKPAVKVAAKTYRAKFEPLLARHQPVVSTSMIEALEKEVLNTPEPSPSAKITSDPKKMQTILTGSTIDRLNNLFKITSIPRASINESVFDDLSASQEKAFVRLAEENRSDLKAHVESSKDVATDRKSVEQVQLEVQQMSQAVKAEKNALKTDLLQFVERFNTPAGILAMRRLVGKDQKPSLDFLISLWRRNEIDQPWKGHPLQKLGMIELSASMLKELDQNIAHYLELTTSDQHLGRILDSTQSYLKTCSDQPSAQGDSKLAENIYDALQVKRYFSLDPSDSPDFRDLLFLEFTQEVILHSQQVDTIRDMLSDPNAVRQLRMGGGKSKVLLPMLAKRKANGANLVMLMLPEELYETNCKDLDRTNKQLFGQEMHRFDFSRKTDKSPEALNQIYARLLTTMKEKGFVMTTKRSVLSLRNSYLEMIYKLQKTPTTDLDGRAELIKQIRAMSKILKVFHDKTDVIADEVDACLDVRKEVNFSLGDSERVDRIKADIGSELASLIISAKESDPLYELGQVLKKNTQAAIAPEKREEMMKVLTGVYYDQHIHQLSRLTRKQFIDYIMNESGSEDVEKLIFGLKKINVDLFKQIATVKAFINRGFGTTLGRVGNVNYGRDPITQLWTIPYKASNTPNVGSEFDDEIEQISFTIQDYIQNGVEYKQVYQVIAKMRNKALEELRSYDEDQFVSINDTEGGKEFLAFIKEVDPHQTLGHNITLSAVYTPKKIEALVAAINSTAEGKLNYCNQQIASNIRQFSAQINSVSTDVPDVVRNFAGFTGTPWNRHAYHDKIHAEKKLGVDGSTWAIMLGRDVQIPSFDFDPDRPIESLLEGLDIVGNYQAVVDTGAYLRGTDNHEFIDAAFKIAQENGKKLAAGVYFDEAGRIVKKQSATDTALPIEIAPETDLGENITLYDQAHTFGADIKQDRKAIAIVTIGENTFIRDLFQSVWRLRKLHQEQRIVLAVSSKIKERILNGEKREITKEDIYKFCLMNEARREAEDNYRSEREKIQGLAKRTVIPKIVDLIAGNASDEQIIKMATELGSEEAELFVKVRPNEAAYDQYATLKQEQEPAVLFEKMKEAEKIKCEKVARLFEPIDKKTAGYFTSLANSIVKRPTPAVNLFPNKVESILHGGGEVEQEAQAEVEQELNLMLETEVEQETEVLNEVLIPMVQSGAAGHGDVSPLNMNVLTSTVRSGQWSNQMLRQLNHSLAYFDPNIFCSAVFERNLLASGGTRVSPQCVFYSNRKPVKQVLITKHQNVWSMVIPTVHEAHAVCRQFVKDAKDDIQSVEVALSPTKPLILYKTGEDRSENLPFVDKADQDQFYRLYIQAKLFNGEIEFTSKEEIEALKTWLIEKGPDEFKGYFEKNILAAKPRRFEELYQKSSLYKVFNELVQQPATVDVA